MTETDEKGLIRSRVNKYVARAFARRLSGHQKYKPRRVLLVIYTHPEWHSTFVFTSQVISEHGFEVDIVCKDTDKRSFLGPVDFGPRVRIHATASFSSRWRTQVDYLAFFLRVAYLVKRRQPTYVIGYDLFGFAATYLAAPRRMIIYHNLDLSEGRSRMMRTLKLLERVGARRAELVIASSPARARILQQEAHLPKMPTVVMNCQRLRMTEKRTGELRRILEAEGIVAERIVLRLGSIDPGHGIDATIRSMLLWDCANWTLVLAGSGSVRFLAGLRRLVRDLQLESRVLFLPCVPRDLWYDCLYSAHLGISLYEVGNLNHASMAGAGNKLNLYLKAGIPSIVPALPDFEAFAEQHGASEVALPTDPGSIAQAVNTVLRDEQNYRRYCEEAAQAFESEYNFEKQFGPVLTMLSEETPVPAVEILLDE